MSSAVKRLFVWEVRPRLQIWAWKLAVQSIELPGWKPISRSEGGNVEDNLSERPIVSTKKLTFAD